MKNLDYIVFKMLRESTGRALCDSGDAYGRHWQRNAKKSLKDFRAEPEFMLKFSVRGDKLSIDTCTASVFHFLTKCLDSHEAKLTAAFWKWCASGEGRYINSPGSFEDWLATRNKPQSNKDKLFGRRPPGYVDEINTVNTYNGENLLSQILQYTVFRIDGDEHVGMSVHQGCDARGGYGSIRVFRYDPCNNGCSPTLSDNAQCRLFADNTADDENPTLFGSPRDFNNAHGWVSYNGGYSFDFDNGYGSYPDIEQRQLGDFPATKDPELRGKGHVYVDPEGNGYSPLNGAKLEADW
jgi:hypothetical protein